MVNSEVASIEEPLRASREVGRPSGNLVGNKSTTFFKEVEIGRRVNDPTL